MNILEASLWACFIIAPTLIVRFCALHKIPKSAFPALWGVALIRLLVPLSIYIPLPANTPGAPAIGGLDIVHIAANRLMPTQEITPPQAQAFPWLSLVWAVFAVCLLILFLSKHLRFHKIARFAVPSDSAFIDAWLRENAPKWRKVRVRISADIAAPLTYGVFRPVILLPEHVGSNDDDRLVLVLTHEMEHIKRLDVLWKWALLLALCIHWFNPLVWAMYCMANRDLEISCDDKTLQTLGGHSTAAYATALLELAETRAETLPLGNAFSKNAIEERILSMMKRKKVSPIGKAVASLAVVCVALVLLISLASADAKQGAGPSAPAVHDLPAIPADLDEGIKSAILRETSFGTERLMSAGAKDEPGYTADEWEAILSAVAMGLIDWDETIPQDGAPSINLDEGLIVSNMTSLAGIQFYTSGGEVHLSTGDEDYEGEFYLYDANSDASYLQAIAIDTQVSSGVFTGLAPSRVYYIVPSDRGSPALVRITAE